MCDSTLGIYDPRSSPTGVGPSTFETSDIGISESTASIDNPRSRELRLDRRHSSPGVSALWSRPPAFAISGLGGADSTFVASPPSPRGEL